MRDIKDMDGRKNAEVDTKESGAKANKHTSGEKKKKEKEKKKLEESIRFHLSDRRSAVRVTGMP